MIVLKNVGAPMIRNMNDLPDRLCIDPTSPYYDPMYVRVGVRFDGKERTNVAEYCVSQGWVRLQAGGKDRNGKQLTFTYKGVVEPYIRP